MWVLGPAGVEWDTGSPAPVSSCALFTFLWPHWRWACRTRSASEAVAGAFVPLADIDRISAAQSAAPKVCSVAWSCDALRSMVRTRGAVRNCGSVGLAACLCITSVIRRYPFWLASRSSTCRASTIGLAKRCAVLAATTHQGDHLLTAKLSTCGGTRGMPRAQVSLLEACMLRHAASVIHPRCCMRGRSPSGCAPCDLGWGVSCASTSIGWWWWRWGSLLWSPMTTSPVESRSIVVGRCVGAWFGARGASGVRSWPPRSAACGGISVGPALSR